MQITAVRATILTQYRKARAVNTPLEAITAVTQHYAHWACSHHSMGLVRNRDADHAAWQECNLLADEISQRIMRLSPSGMFWMTGQLAARRTVFELYCLGGLPAVLVSECPTAECALKHAIDHLRTHAGCFMKLLNTANGKVSAEFTDALSVHDWVDISLSLL